MNENERATLLFSQSVCAMLRGFGMISENFQRIHRGESLAYTDKAFEDVINEFSIGWNSALIMLRD